MVTLEYICMCAYIPPNKMHMRTFNYFMTEAMRMSVYKQHQQLLKESRVSALLAAFQKIWTDWSGLVIVPTQ